MFCDHGDIVTDETCFVIMKTDETCSVILKNRCMFIYIYIYIYIYIPTDTDHGMCSLVRFYYQCGQHHLALEEIRRMQAKDLALEQDTQVLLEELTSLNSQFGDSNLI